MTYLQKPCSARSGRASILRAHETSIIDETRGLIGETTSTQTSVPIERSDIGRWAIAVYHPKVPPHHFWDGEFAATAVWVAIVALEEYNPVAWMAAELAPPPYRAVLQGQAIAHYSDVRMRRGDVIGSRTYISEHSSGPVGWGCSCTRPSPWTSTTRLPSGSSDSTPCSSATNDRPAREQPQMAIDVDGLKPGYAIPEWEREGPLHRVAAVDGDFSDHHIDDEAGRHEGFEGAFIIAPLSHAYLHGMLREWIGEQGRIIGIDTRLKRPRAPKLQFAMTSAAREAIAMMGPLRLPATMVGRIEQSMMRSPSTPRTRSCPSTTSSSAGPIAQVATAW